MICITCTVVLHLEKSHFVIAKSHLLKNSSSKVTATVSPLVCYGLIVCIKEHYEFSQSRPA